MSHTHTHRAATKKLIQLAGQCCGKHTFSYPQPFTYLGFRSCQCISAQRRVQELVLVFFWAFAAMESLATSLSVPVARNHKRPQSDSQLPPMKDSKLLHALLARYWYLNSCPTLGSASYSSMVISIHPHYPQSRQIDMNYLEFIHKNGH